MNSPKPASKRNIFSPTVYEKLTEAEHSLCCVQILNCELKKNPKYVDKSDNLTFKQHEVKQLHSKKMNKQDANLDLNLPWLGFDNKRYHPIGVVCLPTETARDLNLEGNGDGSQIKVTMKKNAAMEMEVIFKDAYNPSKEEGEEQTYITKCHAKNGIYWFAEPIGHFPGEYSFRFSLPSEPDITPLVWNYIIEPPLVDVDSESEGPSGNEIESREMQEKSVNRTKCAEANIAYGPEYKEDTSYFLVAKDSVGSGKGSGKSQNKSNASSSATIADEKCRIAIKRSSNKMASLPIEDLVEVPNKANANILTIELVKEILHDEKMDMNVDKEISQRDGMEESFEELLTLLTTKYTLKPSELQNVDGNQIPSLYVSFGSISTTPVASNLNALHVTVPPHLCHILVNDYINSMKVAEMFQHQVVCNAFAGIKDHLVTETELNKNNFLLYSELIVQYMDFKTKQRCSGVREDQAPLEKKKCNNNGHHNKLGFSNRCACDFITTHVSICCSKERKKYQEELDACNSNSSASDDKREQCNDTESFLSKHEETDTNDASHNDSNHNSPPLILKKSYAHAIINKLLCLLEHGEFFLNHICYNHEKLMLSGLISEYMNMEPEMHANGNLHSKKRRMSLSASDPEAEGTSHYYPFHIANICDPIYLLRYLLVFVQYYRNDDIYQLHVIQAIISDIVSELSENSYQYF